MSARTPENTILDIDELSTTKLGASNNNDVINIDDPALIKESPPKFDADYTKSVFQTEINEKLKQKIIQVTDFLAVNPAGNIGEIQFNNNFNFDANEKFKWNLNTNLLEVSEDINVSNITYTSNIINSSNISVTINTANNYIFRTDGKFKTPYYTFPYEDGINNQSLVTDGNGNLQWDSVSTPYSRVYTISGATNIVVHDVSNGFIFNHINIANNFTLNLVGITDLTANKSITITVILNQNNPAYLPIEFQINGNTQTINWSDNELPIGLNDHKDVIVYNIHNLNSTYKIYGHYVSYKAI